MQNLIQLFTRYYYTLLLLLFEALGFLILTSANGYQRNGFFAFSNELTGGVYQQFNDITSYVNLKEVNQQLINENEQLLNQLSANKYLNVTYTFQADSSFADSVLVDTTAQVKYEFIAARVINSTTQRLNNFTIINKGLNAGIDVEMAVIAPSGIVGIVKQVSANYASVIPVINTSFKVGAKLKHNQYFGFVSWGGPNTTQASLQGIPSHVQVSVGDTVITRGDQSVFPEGYLLGLVNTVEPIPGEDFYDITINLAVDFKRLSNVYVLKNWHREEILELENEFITED